MRMTSSKFTIVLIAAGLFAGPASGQAPQGYSDPRMQPPQQMQGYAPMPQQQQAMPQQGAPYPTNGYLPVPPQGYYPAQGQQQQFYAPQGYPQNAGFPAGQGQAQNGFPPPRAGATTVSVAQWFTQYDQIRHQAQMTPQERQRADNMMSHGLSLLVPGDEKAATRSLLSSLAARYQRACGQLRALPLINQTSNLHQSYYQYFANAGLLFNDYGRVQDNIFIKDESTGQPLAAGLLQRKQMLEALEHQCKQLDAQTRGQFGIKPYPW